MATFKEANQVRLMLKMKLHEYSWYSSSLVVLDNDGYAVIINVNILDNKVRKLVPQVVNDVSIKIELE